MGFFSNSPTQESPTTVTNITQAAPSQDGGYIAPDRTARAACWEGRDAFFRCLDANSIIDSVKDDEKARTACPKDLAAFERDCASSWVSHVRAYFCCASDPASIRFWTTRRSIP